MNTNTFMSVVESTHQSCIRLLTKRGSKYTPESSGDDRLIQFKKAGALSLQHPVCALGGMMSKHTTRLYDMIEEVRSGRMASEKEWNETIHDHINYLYLLKGILKEERE